MKNMSGPVALSLVLVACLHSAAAAPAPQMVVARVEKMPRLPEPLHVIDWKQASRDYYKALFDPELKGTGLPAVNLASDRKHFGFDAYLRSDRRRDPRGEAQACLLPVVGAQLLGLDMTRLHGVNWIDPTSEWFDPRTKIWSNRPGSGHSLGHVIYDYWPLAIGTLLAAQFPTNEAFARALRQQADVLVEMGRKFGYPGQLNLDQDYQYRDGQWVVLPRRIDSNAGNAASLAWALYAAHIRSPNPEYVALAKESIAWWLAHPGRYEMSHAMGPLVLARLNAEQGGDFDMRRMLDIWFGDYTAFTPELPESQVMPWGITAGTRPGDVTCDGLDGACWRKTREGGFYAFAMGSYQGPGWLLPAVRYDQRIARAVARYALHAANSCRYFLGIDLDGDHQDHKDWRDAMPDGVGYLFSYEGVRSEAHHADAGHGFRPYATGDPLPLFSKKYGGTNRPNYWADKKAFSHAADNIALYMGASMGFLGAVYNATDVEGIIAWDLNVTDHFGPPSYPTRLLHNPYNGPRSVTLNVGDATVDLYDTVSAVILQKNVRGDCNLLLAPDQTVVVVMVPANRAMERVGRQLRAGGIAIDYRL